MTQVDGKISAEGYLCTCAFDGKEAADYIEKEDFDLILLDIMLPEIDGYELLEYIKPLGTPVLFLTAKSAVDDRIRGLRAGADDYISKPFQVGEMTARVEAVLRRYGKAGKKLSLGDVEIDTGSRVVYRAGEPVDLTVKEYELLTEHGAVATFSGFPASAQTYWFDCIFHFSIASILAMGALSKLSDTYSLRHLLC